HFGNSLAAIEWRRSHHIAFNRLWSWCSALHHGIKRALGRWTLFHFRAGIVAGQHELSALCNLHVRDLLRCLDRCEPGHSRAWQRPRLTEKTWPGSRSPRLRRSWTFERWGLPTRTSRLRKAPASIA